MYTLQVRYVEALYRDRSPEVYFELNFNTFTPHSNYMYTDGPQHLTSNNLNFQGPDLVMVVISILQLLLR